MLDEMVERITLALGESVFTTNGQPLEEIVARELTLNHATIATAESCTGGLLAERLTRIPGSSAYFLGGVVCYSNDLKTAWADVPAGIDRSQRRGQSRSRAGAGRGHSPPHRRHAGHRHHRHRRTRRRLAGKTRRPGTHRAGRRQWRAATAACAFPGDRERIRWHASQAALDMVRRYFIYARHGKRLTGPPRCRAQARRDERVRLFVALDIPGRVREALAELSARLKKTCLSARWVRLESAHITLKFIGEVPLDDRVETIREALGEPSRGFAPIVLRFAGLGFFPNERRPRVFWAGIEAGPQLAALAAAIEAKLEPLGHSRRKARFHPHITLARFELSARDSARCAPPWKLSALPSSAARRSTSFISTRAC